MSIFNRKYIDSNGDVSTVMLVFGAGSYLVTITSMDTLVVVLRENK